MAQEVRRFTVTVPAGTAIAAPQVTDLPMPARIVDRVEVQVPPGPKGTMGLQLGSSRTQVLPWNTGSWIILDDRVEAFELEGYIDSGAWQALAYNLGAYAHSFYLTFHLRLPQSAGSGSVVTIPPGDIGGGSGGTLPPDDTEPPGDLTTYAEGFAAGRLDALIAVQVAYGVTPSDDVVTVPAAGTAAATGYADAKAAALAALAAIGTTEPTEPPPSTDGYAIARIDALAAVQSALHGPHTVHPVPAPAIGDPARAAYDAGKAAALAAIRAIRRR